jgi:sarcosine oxidase subunit alpha
VVAYGTEALGVMRIEKGHAAGNELNGQTTARDLGMGRMVSKKKDCIGNTLSERAALNEEDGLSLVGLRPVARTKMLKAGAHFVSGENPATTAYDEGWMTSVAYSPSLGHSIGLGFVKAGTSRMGEIIRAADPLRGEETEVEIVSAHFVDPEGNRLHG